MNSNRPGGRDDENNVRPKLSLEEQVIIAERRRKREEREAEIDRREMAQIKPVKLNRQNAVKFAFLFVAFFLVVIGIIAVILQMQFFGLEIFDNGNYKVFIDDYDVSRNVGGAVYVDMGKVASLLDLTLAGDPLSPKYVTRDGDDISFTYESKIARVNSQSVILNLPARKIDGKLYVPVTAIKDLVSGLSFSATENNDLVVEITGKVSFIAKSNDAALADLYGEYGKYDTSADSEYLLLVNKTHLLNNTFVPEDLKSIPTSLSTKSGLKLRSLAEDKLEKMLTDMYAAGYNYIRVTSAYRDYDYQAALFNTYISEEMEKDPSLTIAEAQGIVATYSAVPGTSEHQSGLCVDLFADGMSDLDETFEDYEAFDWLTDNAHKYGFILRFPEGKTGITGYTYEPWHYRYVGEYHAAVMHALGLTLEEYTDFLSK